MTKILSAAEAKARFSECLRLVERGEPVVITRYGKPVAALVTSEDLQHFERLRAANSDQGLAGVIGRWDDSAEFVGELERIIRDRGGPRSASDL